MKYLSTKKNSEPVNFKQALFRGLAPDGGLYYPEQMEDLSALFGAFGPGTGFRELASKVTSRLLRGEVDEETASAIASRAFSFEPVLSRITDRLSLLELFHGPTCAFKDFGACFMAASMEEFLRKEGGHTTILVATSGDTGSAVAKAFHGKEGIDVVILYPSGRVSNLQEKQLTTLGGNVTALEVEGAFDDCQRIVKEAFCDAELARRLTLTSANSINLGRLLPQSFYYIYGFSRLDSGLKKEALFCVPSGNFGNLTAGVYAWKWGLAVKGFVAATNINDVVPEYLLTSDFRPRASKHTLSNAMDVGNPSNFERLLALFGTRDAMADILYPEVVTDEETLDTISRVYAEYGRFIDPHTAVGFLASERFLEKRENKAAHLVILSTAHPAKFMETVLKATGRECELPDALKEALRKKKESIKVKNTLNELKDFLLSR